MVIAKYEIYFLYIFFVDILIASIALSKALEGFNLDGKLKKPNFEYDCEQVRYEHRFAPFGSVMTPPPVQYQQYKEMTNVNRYEVKPKAVDLYGAACKYFHQAKTLFENVPNPTDEVRILNANVDVRR